MNNYLSYCLSFITPLVLERVYSPINGLITVEKYFGKNRIAVDGFWQSGEYSKKVMGKALKNLRGVKKSGNKILLLGLGGGSAVEVINSFDKAAGITGVDIDPLMVDIGRRYFKLETAANLQIKIKDAYDFISKHKGRNIYDIVLVDLYIGCQYPPFVEEKKYYGCIKRLLKRGGVYIFNGSYTGQKKEETDRLVKKTKEFFIEVEQIHLKPNLIIRGYNI